MAIKRIVFKCFFLNNFSFNNSTCVCSKTLITLLKSSWQLLASSKLRSSSKLLARIRLSSECLSSTTIILLLAASIWSNHSATNSTFTTARICLYIFDIRLSWAWTSVNTFSWYTFSLIPLEIFNLTCRHFFNDFVFDGFSASSTSLIP